ncbi:hypothetical protein DFH11DRAFT_247463 [Phellopilus nigrolimitatus]|nr:hypothetical protein DFH11DRAFT_247463 [Phellopilus nigrolimitatus]
MASQSATSLAVESDISALASPGLSTGFHSDFEGDDFSASPQDTGDTRIEIHAFPLDAASTIEATRRNALENVKSLHGVIEFATPPPRPPRRSCHTPPLTDDVFSIRIRPKIANSNTWAKESLEEETETEDHDESGSDIGTQENVLRTDTSYEENQYQARLLRQEYAEVDDSAQSQNPQLQTMINRPVSPHLTSPSSSISSNHGSSGLNAGGVLEPSRILVRRRLTTSSSPVTTSFSPVQFPEKKRYSLVDLGPVDPIEYPCKARKRVDSIKSIRELRPPLRRSERLDSIAWPSSAKSSGESSRNSTGESRSDSSSPATASHYTAFAEMDIQGCIMGKSGRAKKLLAEGKSRSRECVIM